MAMSGRAVCTAVFAAVGLVLVGGGCASKPDQATTAPTTTAGTVVATASATTAAGLGPGSPPPPSQADVTVTVSISGDAVSPPPGRVKVAVGQTVRIEVRSDHDDEVHVHGYDIEAPVRPDTPATITFVADRSGLFEVESHHPATLLTQLLVR
jgi:hypothetical protein